VVAILNFQSYSDINFLACMFIFVAMWQFILHVSFCIWGNSEDVGTLQVFVLLFYIRGLCCAVGVTGRNKVVTVPWKSRQLELCVTRTASMMSWGFSRSHYGRMATATSRFKGLSTLFWGCFPTLFGDSIQLY
jgi:hypothetical protein